MSSTVVTTTLISFVPPPPGITVPSSIFIPLTLTIPLPPAITTTVLSTTTSEISIPSSSISTPSTAISQPTPIPTGFVAALGIVGALLALSLIVILYLLFRRRRLHPFSTSTSSGVHSYDPAILNLKNTIANLELSLKEKDLSLRHAQSALLDTTTKHSLSSSETMPTSSLNDKQIHTLFTHLNRDITDWVLTHFKTSSAPSLPLPPDLTTILSRSHPHYSKMLHDPHLRLLLLRSIVADILSESFTNFSILGPENSSLFSRLNFLISHSSPSTSHPTPPQLWRSQTLSLLLSTPHLPHLRSALTSNLTTSINTLLTTISPPSPSSSTIARCQHLNQIVSNAVTLFLTLWKEPVDVRWSPPYHHHASTNTDIDTGVAFNTAEMEDIMQEREEEGVGSKTQKKVVSEVVFPAVTTGQGRVVFKAQVVVAPKP